MQKAPRADEGPLSVYFIGMYLAPTSIQRFAYYAHSCGNLNTGKEIGFPAFLYGYV